MAIQNRLKLRSVGRVDVLTGLAETLKGRLPCGTLAGEDVPSPCPGILVRRSFPARALSQIRPAPGFPGSSRQGEFARQSSGILNLGVKIKPAEPKNQHE